MFIQRRKKKFFSALIALALFGAGILVAFHHHEVETKSQEHCATCHLGASVRAGDVGGDSVAIRLPTLFALSLDIPSNEVPAFSLLRTGKFSQAPPQV